MKVLHVLNSGNPGGVEQHILDLIKGLVLQGQTVYIVCNEGPIAVWYREVGATVITRKIKIDIDPEYIFGLASFIRDNKIDVVHTHELKAGVNGILAGKLGGAKKIFSHIHTPMSEWQVPGSKRLLTQAEIMLYSRVVNMFSTAEIALTESKKLTKIREGVKASKIKVIPNGIELQRFTLSQQKKDLYRQEFLAKYKLPPDARLLGNVARLSPEKGQIYLIEAFAKVLDHYTGKEPLYLILAGGGILELELKNKAQLLKIDDKIVFTGIFMNQDLPQIYSVLELFVFPSLAEGFGLALVEAMANKLPVICSDLDILQEVGGPDVFYFQKSKPDALAEVMLKVLAIDSDTKKSIGEKLYIRAESKYGVDQFVKNYIKLYEGKL